MLYFSIALLPQFFNFPSLNEKPFEELLVLSYLINFAFLEEGYVLEGVGKREITRSGLMIKTRVFEREVFIHS